MLVVTAHSVHYAVVFLGIIALTVLLVPLRHRVGDPADPHAIRVAALRERIATGSLATLEPLAPPRVSAPVRSVASSGTTLLLAAVVASAAAGGVHAAVAPGHVADGLAVGTFFLVTALAQSAWAAAAIWRPTRPLLLAGLAGNAAVVAVWAISRTSGLPGVEGGRPEAVGALDLAATCWELVVAAGCFWLLSHPPPNRPPLSWDRWPLAARAWATASVALLGALTFLDLHH